MTIEEAEKLRKEYMKIFETSDVHYCLKHDHYENEDWQYLFLIRIKEGINKGLYMCIDFEDVLKKINDFRKKEENE